MADKHGSAPLALVARLPDGFTQLAVSRFLGNVGNDPYEPVPLVHSPKPRLIS